MEAAEGRGNTAFSERPSLAEHPMGSGYGPHRDLRPKLLQPLSVGEHRTLATGWVLDSVGGAINRKDICGLTGWALCPHKLPSLESGTLSKLV